MISVNHDKDVGKIPNSAITSIIETETEKVKKRML